MSMLKLTGWVEVNGQRLTPQEIEEILKDRPDEVLTFSRRILLRRSRLPGPGPFRDHAGQLPERDAHLQRCGERTD